MIKALVTSKFLSISRIIWIFALILFSLSNQIFAQNGERNHPPDPSAHHEILDHEYVPVSRENQQRSPAFSYKVNNITTTQVNVDANGQNIVGDAANEPSIAVDPTNRNNISIGWRQFNTISNNFRQAGYGYSTNGGQSWTFPGVIEPGVFRSDPVLDADDEGNIFYNSLTNTPEYFCDVFKSSNGGATWDGGTFAQGGDKQWMVIDKIDGVGLGNIYAYWTSFYSVCYPDHFTRSTDTGASFEDCVTIPNEPYWGTLAVGPEGELYIGGTIGFNFQVAKSTTARNPGLPVSWELTADVNLDGTIANGYGPNPGGLLGQTLIAVDTSTGSYRGYVYLLCSVERNSNSDPLDIMFSRSTNGGATWSAPIKINDDNNTTAYQWFGTMSVAPNGRIDVVWLDTRDNPGSVNSALYYSNSKDGGVTWSQNEKLSESFNPHVGWPQQNKMGDYFDMESDSSGASLAWAATFNGEQDVYYSYILDTTGTVPVELTSFSGNFSSGVVSLSWSTGTELNNYGFEIERSTDQANWQTIGFKEGRGTTSEPQQYFYQDNLFEMSSTNLYYRLKQLDFLGNYEHSDVIEVYAAPATYSLSQNFPNPFNPSTTINYQLPVNAHVTLKVFDILGNEIVTLVNEEKSAGEHNVEFDASHLGSGIYFYSIIAGEFYQSKKMLLVK